MSLLDAWQLAPDERDFADSVAGAAAQLRPLADAVEAGERDAGALLDALAPLELAGAAVPEAHGGAGATPRTALVAVAALAPVAPVAAVLTGQAQAAAWALATSGRPLPEGCVTALLGGALVAVAAAPGLVADARERRLALRGAVLVDGAPWARGLLLAGTDEGGVACSALVWPLPSEGVRRRARARTGLRGLRGERVALQLELDGAVGVALPAAVARRALAYDALASAVAGAAVAATALEEARAYVAERRQFGGPLAHLPIVRELLGGAHERLARTSARLGGLASADVAAWTADDAGALRAAARTAVEACDVALQLHGGYGYVDEFPAERRLRDALSLRARMASASAPLAPPAGIASAAMFDVIRLPDAAAAREVA